jgi:predicted anti-sigma-YlaC factor YlaD
MSTCEHCKDTLEILSEYLDGELDSGLCAEIEHHMSECGNCRIVVDTLRKTIILYRDYGHEQVPADAKDRLYAVLHLPQREPGTRGAEQG